MNTYETKHFDIRTSLDFDYVNSRFSDPRVTLKRQLVENLWLKVSIMIRGLFSEPKEDIMCSLYLNDRLVIKAVKIYDHPVDVINLASDEMKELVHVNDEAEYFFVENYIENSILPPLQNFN